MDRFILWFVTKLGLYPQELYDKMREIDGMLDEADRIVDQREKWLQRYKDLRYSDCAAKAVFNGKIEQLGNEAEEMLRKIHLRIAERNQLVHEQWWSD